MVGMSRKEAVSATDPDWDRYCLLREGGAETYRCVETAANLSASTEETRLQAFWRHYKTHIGPYTRWTVNRKLFDQTGQCPDPREASAELVKQVLFSFYQKVQERLYDPTRGPPCRYVKRAIKNKFQDFLRRGRHPTPEECAQCFQERGFCHRFPLKQPGEWERQRCLRLPPVERLDAASAGFALAGLQDEWPPAARGGSSVRRPVEDQALQDVLLDSIWSLIDKVLTPDQRTVLIETVLHHRTSREIALLIDTTPGNVDQLRHRGLQRLSKVLTP